MMAAVYGLAGTMFTAVCVLLGILARNNGKSPEQVTAQSQAWSLVNGGLVAEVQRLTVKASEAEKRIVDLEHGAERTDEQLRTVRALNLWLSRRVDQLVAFIVELGHEPPAELDQRPPDVEPD